MAHYAFLDENNTVTEVIVGKDENELLDGLDPETWYGNFRGQVCKRTSYNTKGGVYYLSDNSAPHPDQTKAFRKNYAALGYTYDEQRDAFIPPKPYQSWVLDESTCIWNPPTPYPQDGGYYVWDDENVEWKEENFPS